MARMLSVCTLRPINQGLMREIVCQVQKCAVVTKISNLCTHVFIHSAEHHGRDKGRVRGQLGTACYLKSPKADMVKVSEKAPLAGRWCSPLPWEQEKRIQPSQSGGAPVTLRTQFEDQHASGLGLAFFQSFLRNASTLRSMSRFFSPKHIVLQSSFRGWL